MPSDRELHSPLPADVEAIAVQLMPWLTERQSQIVALFMGTGRLTYAQIGAYWGIKGFRVSQILSESMKQIRQQFPQLVLARANREGWQRALALMGVQQVVVGVTVAAITPSVQVDPLPVMGEVELIYPVKPGLVNYLQSLKGLNRPIFVDLHQTVRLRCYVEDVKWLNESQQQFIVRLAVIGA